ncbi:MAG: hypothetical protein EAZ55_00215 [Cytophagales bacterium]|nr:MAG: hypothetical protein EAZ55_00215 [Cytophagales bacterium]
MFKYRLYCIIQSKNIAKTMNLFEHISRNGLTFNHLDENNFTIYNSLKQKVYTYAYFQDYKYSVAIWENYISPEEIKEIYVYVGKYTILNNQHIYGMVNDLRYVDGSFAPINDWFKGNYVLKAIERGFAFSANIVPEEFFARLSLEDLNDNAPYEICNFEDYESAKTWLLEKLSNYHFEKKA